MRERDLWLDKILEEEEPFDVIGLTLNEVRHVVLNVIVGKRPLRLEAAILEARGKSWP